MAVWFKRVFDGEVTIPTVSGSPPPIPKTRCEECGVNSSLQVDHIQARANGGTHDKDNLQCLCAACNNRKGDKLQGTNLSGDIVFTHHKVDSLKSEFSVQVHHLLFDDPESGWNGPGSRGKHAEVSQEQLDALMQSKHFWG